MIHLPSGENSYLQNAIEFTASGEVPIYPRQKMKFYFKSSEKHWINGYVLENMDRSCVSCDKTAIQNLYRHVI